VFEEKAMPKCSYILFSVLACLLSWSMPMEAQCKRPKDDDRPHGANEFILFDKGTVGRIRGEVYFSGVSIGQQAKDIVVELYKYSGGDDYKDVYKTLSEQKRMVACLTGVDGKFSFPEIKPGKYLLRAGTRDRNQYNEAHVMLILKPSRRVNKELKVILTLGT
jgi:hypothetical protein